MPRENIQSLTAILNQNISSILKIDIGDLVSRDLGKGNNFKDYEDVFTGIRDIVGAFEVADVENLPLRVIAVLESHLSTLAALYTSLTNYKVREAVPSKEIRNLIDRLDGVYNDFFIAVSPVIVASKLKKSDFFREQTNVDEYVKAVKLKTETHNKFIDDHVALIEGASQKAIDSALEKVVATNSTIFGEEALSYSRTARVWLAVTFTLLATLVVTAIILLNIAIKNTETHYLINFAVAKIVIITSLYYSLAIALRNYKANRHNAIINKHRQNALNSFEIFSIAANSDPQTKNAVLLEATRTIFANQSTGFVVDGENDSPNKIIEIFKSATDKT